MGGSFVFVPGFWEKALLRRGAKLVLAAPRRYSISGHGTDFRSLVSGLRLK